MCLKNKFMDFKLEEQSEYSKLKRAKLDFTFLNYILKHRNGYEPCEPPVQQLEPVDRTAPSPFTFLNPHLPSLCVPPRCRPSLAFPPTCLVFFSIFLVLLAPPSTTFLPRVTLTATTPILFRSAPCQLFSVFVVFDFAVKHF